MVCKGFHYKINLGNVSNFYINIYRLSWIMCQRIYRSDWNRRNMDFPRRVLKGHNWDHIYSLYLLFPSSLSILCIVQIKPPSTILFSILSYVKYLNMDDLSFRSNNEVSVLVSTKFKCQILLQGGLLKCLKETEVSIKEWKKEIITKKYILLERIVHIKKKENVYLMS